MAFLEGSEVESLEMEWLMHCLGGPCRVRIAFR